MHRYALRVRILAGGVALLVWAGSAATARVVDLDGSALRLSFPAGTHALTITP